MSNENMSTEILDIPEEIPTLQKSAEPPKPHGKKVGARAARRKAREAAGAEEKPEKSRKKAEKTARAAKKASYRSKHGGKKKGRHSRKKGGKRPVNDKTLAINLMLSAGILVFLLLGGLLIHQHGQFLAMKRAVEAQTFYDGTSVEGVDVSGRTLKAALKHWQNKIEPKYAGRRVTLDGSGTVTAADMGYESDYEAVLRSAWSAGRQGSLEERYEALLDRQSHPMAWQVHRSLWSDAAVDAYIAAVSEKLDAPAVDAEIQSFDVDTYAFVLTESREGRKLNAEKLKSDIAGALQAGGGEVTLQVEAVPPKVTKEDVNSEYGMISNAVTNASSSSSNRIRNIRTAVGIINGYCLRDGATFSFNEVVGQRTSDRGFRKATAYSGGDVTEEIGGGICQVSTTLFNAAVKADMEIVERHNHSLTVSYVDKGKDAAVSWDSQDLRFTNHSGDNVYICCYVSDDKRVRFAIFGRLLPNGETITLEGKTTETIKYDTEYEQNAFMAPGQQEVISPGKNGYKAEAYKIRWDAQGNRISKELLCKSVYKVRNEVIQYGR